MQPTTPSEPPRRPTPARAPALSGVGSPLAFQRMLNRAAKDPGWILRDRRCLKPEFCEQFFEICDDKALQDPPVALRYATIAAELARKIGDPHLIHRAQGVLVHAHVSRRELKDADRLLEDYWLSATTCCKACSADWMLRRADVQVESVDGRGACETVERSRRELGDELDADTNGRQRFIEAIGHLFQGDRDAALASAGEALRELSLSSPRGYFIDSLGLLAICLKGYAEDRHYRLAERHLNDFQERIKGLRDWTDARVRKAWVEGQIAGHLGDWRRAVDRLDGVRQALLKCGPPRHALAVTLDLCQAHARRVNDVSLRAIQRMLGICQRQRDLDHELRKRLKLVLKNVSWYPEKAPWLVAACRQAFIVPVPGLLAEMAMPQIPEGWRVASAEGSE